MVSPPVISSTEKYGTSTRAMCEILSASTSNINSKDKVLSVSSVWRKRKLFTEKISEDILADELNEPTDYYIIHWDTKNLRL